MSSIGSPLDTSLIQTAQAQQVSGKARDRERAVSDRARRQQDLFELRVAGLEGIDATRRLPGNESEEAAQEHHAHPNGPPEADEDGDERPRIDVQA